MARNGYRIFDSDAHVGHPADILERYLTEVDRSRLKDWEQWKSRDRVTGRHTVYQRGVRSYQRRLGLAGPDEAAKQRVGMTDFKGAHKGKDPTPLVDDDPAERIKDMDLEGVDVNLTLPSSWFGTWLAGDDVDLELAWYRAYHRWMADYCGAFPARIKGVILVGFRDIEASLKEIERCAREDWPLGVFVYAPAEVPLDHPDLEPIWAACQVHDLSVVLHTFTTMPPYSPGSLDTWGNLWIQRSAAHPWCGMRNMASILGSGIMDRYPRLRVGVLEAGHSWLPFWMARLDEHAQSVANALPALKMKPSEYVLSGRFFQSIEMNEGERLTKAVIDLLGDGVLMFATDYPHSESWFPKGVETVMAWDLPEKTRQNLFWDNAVKYYARYRGD